MSETTTDETSKTRLVKIFSTDSYGMERMGKRLVTRPFARLHLAWVGLGKSALSPVSYCAISGLAPKEMWEALKKEKGFSIGLCFSTKLPVIHWDEGFSNQHIENMYDEDWIQEYSGRDYDERSGRSCPCADCVDKPVPERKIRKRDQVPPMWKGFVEQYLGEDWKTHATRDFDPFDTKCAVSKTGWDQLLNAYYLKLHKDGEPVSEEANSAYVAKRVKKMEEEEAKLKEGLSSNFWYYK